MRYYPRFRSVCLTLMLLTLATISYGQSQLADGAMDLGGDWQFRLGDSPIDENGDFLWLNDAWDDPAWTTTDSPYFAFEQRRESRKAWIRIELPAPPIPNALFVNVVGIFETFQNEQLIYRFGTLTQEDDIDYFARMVHTIPLQAGVVKQIISFRVHSDRLGVGIRVSSAQLVNAEQKIGELAASEVDNILFGSLFIFLGIFSLFLFVKNSFEKIYLGYGVFTLGMGCWTWSTTVLLHWLIYAPELWFYIYQISLYTATAGFFYFSEQILNPELKKYARFLWISHLLCLIAAAIQDQLPGMNWSDANRWYFIYQPVSQIAMLGVLLWNARTGSSEAKQLLFSQVLMLFFGVAEMLDFHLLADYRPSLLPFGVFLTVVIQGRILLRRYTSMNRKLAQYSLQLESRTEELEDSNRALLQMDRLKNEFLANTSHELRTPLHGMTGLAEGMLDDVRNDAVTSTSENSKRDSLQKNLNFIVQSGQRLSRLVDDILDFSRMEHDDLKLQTKAVDLRAMVDVIFVLCQPLVDHKPVELKMELPHDCPPVEADEYRLQQILYNLLGNAIKFTHAGEVRVTAAVENDKLRIQVHDTGIGIDSEYLQNIFESFQQVDSVSKSYSCIGLGLSITRKLVEMHEGEIFAESVLGKGSCFTLLLPISSKQLAVTDSVERDKAQFSKSTFPNLRNNAVKQTGGAGSIATVDLSLGNAPGISQKSYNILVVDDDQINLQVVINQLSPLGYALSTAISGLDALEIIEDDGPFDLVILDLMMPKMNGYEACEHIRKQFSAVELPIILLTARSQTEDLVRGLQMGANDYLTKPFAKEELLARVKGHLTLKEAHTQLQENISLRKEIKLKEQTAQDLILAQQRLSQLLNHMDEAVCAFSQDNRISFLNTPAITQYQLDAENLIGKPLANLIPDFDIEKVMTQLQPWKSGPEGTASLARALTFSLNSMDISADVLLWETSSESGGVLIFGRAKYSTTKSGELTHSSTLPSQKSALDRRLHYLELSAETLFSSSENSSDSNSIDPAETPRTSTEIRSSLVELLNKAVHYWESTTNKTKVELAEESGLWIVHLEQRGVFRARTLERHQKLETLPKSPRWKEILQTTQFVLEHHPDDKVLRAIIEPAFESLKRRLEWQSSSIN
ncbi:MAG: hypothetical protein COA96_13640 [SAR86 cluster bacterium]|uniref:histidine kinase n=1 Tax=SAR86 cluster bacterium TaxID=2030880 RepID=A0A2A5AV81_9GAMM|nr:MAG: hypothetical protein COA96_13640 [SAR86 cluster bacterium]